MSTTLPTKRKRTQISYVADDVNDDADFPPNKDALSDDEMTDTDDDDFRPGKKSLKRKTPIKKKARLASKSKQQQKKQKPFRFMDLPTELRDMVYEIALTDGNGAISLVAKTKAHRRTVTRGVIHSQRNGYYFGNASRHRRRGWYGEDDRLQSSHVGTEHRMLIPALLAVSKQVNAEAGDILYNQEIIVADTSVLLSFLGTIGSNRARLSELTIKGWGTGRGTYKANNFAALTMLSACTNLKTLFLDCSIGYYRNDLRRVAAQFYRDGHYFLEAYGAAHGRKDAAIDIIELSPWYLAKDPNSIQDANKEVEVDPKAQAVFEEELSYLLTR